MYLDFAKEDAIAENKKYIESLKQEETQAIATAEAEQKLAEAQKETVSNTSNSNNSQIEELKSDIQEVKTELGDVKDRISSIESNGFENVRDDVEKTKESVKELNSEFAEMKSNLSSTPQESNISSGDFKEQSTEIDLYHNLEKRKVTYDEIIDRIQTIVSLKEKEKSLSKTSDDTKLYQNLYDENDINWAGDTEGTINRISDRLKEIYIKYKDASLVTSEDISKLDNYEKKIKDTIATVTNMSASEKGYNFVSGQKELDKIHNLLNENSKMSSEAKAKIKSYYAEIESGNPSMSLDRIHGEIMKIYNAEVEAGRAGRSFFDTLKNSGFHQLAAQMAGMFGVYDVINELKQVASTVRELDTAYTEMRKVSNESAQSLKNFQKESFSTADSVGTTALALQDATATWMRLGESLDEAKESAKDATVLLNVSEFENIDEATDSLVAMSQAYKELDKMEIIDVLDKIGNEYSISTNELSTALKDSAAVLKTQGNDLAESVALITAGNAITQDVSKTAGETLPERYRNIFYRTYLTARAA